MPLDEHKVETDYRRLTQLMRLGLGLIQENRISKHVHLLYHLSLPFKLVIKLKDYKKTVLEGSNFFANPSLNVIHKLNTI